MTKQNNQSKLQLSETEDILRVQGVNAKGFGIIPKLVMKDPRLPIQSKAIYAYFRSYAGAGDTAFPSVSLIMKDLGIKDVETFRKYRKIIEDCGYITVAQEVRSNGKFGRNIYTLIENPIPRARTVSPEETVVENTRYGKNPLRIKSVTDKTGNGKNPLPVKPTPNKNSSLKNNSSFKNNQSVSPATEEEVKTSCQTTDRQTSPPPPTPPPEKPKQQLPVCEVTEADIKQQIGYSSLAMLGDTSLLDEVVLNMFDMYHSSEVKIKDGVKPQAVVHSVLSKITYWHIEYILDRFKQVTIPIKNKKGYLQTMIYNSVLEKQAHYTNEVKVDQLAWAEELQPSQEQGPETCKQRNAIPQRDNFEQRQYSDEELENFYYKLDAEEVEGARA